MRLFIFSLVFGVSFVTTNLWAQEKLQLHPPTTWQGGWKLASDHAGDGVRITVYTPQTAEVGSLKDLVSVTSTWGGQQQDGVTRLIRAWALHLRTSCPTLAMVLPKLRVENGFTVGYAQLYCPKRTDTGFGGVDFVKAIASDMNAHLIAVSQKTPSFTSPTPGPIQFENNADTEAFFQWLKSTSEYLGSVVRVCRAESSSEMKCSP